MSAQPPRNPLEKVRGTKPWVLDRMIQSPTRPSLQGGRRPHVPRFLVVLFALGVFILVAGACMSALLGALGGSGANATADEATPTEQRAPPALVTLVVETPRVPAVFTPAPPSPSTTPFPLPTSPTTRGPIPTATPFKHTVVSGDTLLGIALKYGVTVQAIQEANGLTGTLIHSGDELIIPKAP